MRTGGLGMRWRRKKRERIARNRVGDTETKEVPLL
jgi:hypothetical protein